MNKIIKKKKGFTLIELIIVIAIIAILAAVTVPRLSGFKEDAKIKSDIANAKIIYNAVASKIADGTITEDITNQSVDNVSQLATYVDQTITPKTTIKSDANTSIATPKFYVNVTVSNETITITAGNASKKVQVYPTQEAPFNGNNQTFSK